MEKKAEPGFFITRSVPDAGFPFPSGLAPPSFSGFY